MKKYNRKLIIAVLIISIALVLYCITAYPTRYYFYLWRLNNTTEGGEIMLVNEKIETLGPHIIPLLVKTYNNVKASKKSRGAAAAGLIKADREQAEELFAKFLEHEEDDVKISAIFDLAFAQSEKYYSRVTKLADSQNEQVRLAVVYYLGCIKKEASIAKLQYLMQTDVNKEVRDSATYGLQRLGSILSK